MKEGEDEEKKKKTDRRQQQRHQVNCNLLMSEAVDSGEKTLKREKKHDRNKNRKRMTDLMCVNEKGQDDE